ncbi:nitrate reductase molybdenum cofactor assembly chaperone [Limobrevibacterium gyesilva]|uniref:Nitrate reductase molybdenum cofactor assembly chaperone n=1 Tax=Limobrevibacterium gyesilva TaxID=2991712 RepID=A0AA41YMR5_9PROT|nr:nitrate reductase molybdenum cofactor assembly chaperone [Limobrevibacterium gyesilva]MCW3476364.1 nitrate reductase molybdenum cofactor assembly chaperone [Limobrevibacterium gyesilva]
MARTYRALAALLSYPTEALQAATGEIAVTLAEEGLVPAPQRAAIDALLRELAATDIYELQERYFGLFDRSRTLSLHLFEHIHGESRDRGQAMADLIELYQSHGLEMAPGELPDFLPLFLEFLSLLPQDEARAMLAEPAGILRALADRLAARNTAYAATMEALAHLAAAPDIGVSDIPDEDPDDLAALDVAWEEAAVHFGPGEQADGCSTDRLRTRLRAAARDASRPPAHDVASA